MDIRPQFAFHENSNDKLVTSEVTLPIVIGPTARIARSSRPWKTERQARKDAAFEAYLGLYENGFLNDNLLPVVQSLEEFQATCHTPMVGFTECKPRKNMLAQLALRMDNDWNSGRWYQYLIEVDISNDDPMSVFMLSPRELPQIPTFELHWNVNVSYTVKISGVKPETYSKTQILAGERITQELLKTAYFTVDKFNADFALLFIPFRYFYSDWDRAAKELSGVKSATAIQSEHRGFDRTPLLLGLVRDSSGYEGRHMFKRSIPGSDHIVVTKFPKRRDFLRKENSAEDVEAYTTETALAASECTFDNVPAVYAMFSLFLPSVLRRLELAMLAEELRSSLLAPVGFRDPHLVQTAITSRAANEIENYERLEFLGDCILKYLVSIQLMLEYPMWPEGHLTIAKESMVSNANQSNRCKATMLDRYIVTDAFNVAKWRPPYIHELQEASKKDEKSNIQRSTKTLADVVEALIGAAYVDGGFPAALRCIKIFFPTARSTSSDDAARQIRNQTPVQHDLRLGSLEKLVGYSFNKVSILLEATTHPSFRASGLAHARPFDRMEFLGDAVLDFIVVKYLFDCRPELSHNVLHLIHSAVVSSELLGFLCLDYGIDESTFKIVSPEDGQFIPHEDTVRRSIWQFMRHSSAGIMEAQQSALAYYRTEGQAIRMALETDSYFPWCELAYFGRPTRKFFTDMIESVVGAIFVDSGGDLDACKAFLERLGLWRILCRIVNEKVNCFHPKSLVNVITRSAKVDYEGLRQDGRYSCSIKIGGIQVGPTVTRGSREEAEAEVAKQAYELLKAVQDEEQTKMGIDLIQLDDECFGRE